MLDTNGSTHPPYGIQPPAYRVPSKAHLGFYSRSRVPDGTRCEWRTGDGGSLAYAIADLGWSVTSRKPQLGHG